MRVCILLINVSLYNKLTYQRAACGLDMQHIHARSSNLLKERRGELLINYNAAGLRIDYRRLCGWNSFVTLTDSQTVAVNGCSKISRASGVRVSLFRII